jgi:hypothetical protein
MRMLKESDIYGLLNKEDILDKEVIQILSGRDTVVLKSEMQPSLDLIKKIYRENITLKILNAIDKNEIVMFQTSAGNSLPVYMPFVKYFNKATGKETVAVNLTNYLTVRKDKQYDTTEYTIDTKKLYCILLPAYLYLRLFDKQAVLPVDALEISAVLWARMFNQVLNRVIALSTNKDKYDAFMYFAIRFFLSYYMETGEVVIKSITDKYMKGKDPYMVNLIEAKCNDAGINLYESFQTFTKTLFNNEFTNTKSIRVNNISDALNSQFYLKKFIELYDVSSVFSLSSYPYFLFSIYSGFYWSYINPPRAFEAVIEDPKEMGRLLIALYKEA